MHGFARTLALVFMLYVAQPSEASEADSLHHLLCTAVIETLMNDPAEALPRLRDVASRMEDPYRATLHRLLAELASVQGKVQPGEPLSADELARFSVALADALVPLDTAPRNATGAIDNLPERLDFLTLLYVARSQIGALRPARELQHSYLGMGIVELAESVDSDLQALGPQHLDSQTLADAWRRWAYVLPHLKHYKTLAAAPLSIKVQLERIGSIVRTIEPQTAGIQ